MKHTCLSGALSLSLIGLLGIGLAGNAAAQSARPFIFVNPVGPPTAAEAIRVQWRYEGTDVLYLRIERENPYLVLTSEDFTGQWDDTSVERGRVYRYRVCAVHVSDTLCDLQGEDGWVAATVPVPEVPPPPPPPPSPPLSFTPELSATAQTGVAVYLRWTVPPSGSIRLSRVLLYRDGAALYDALQEGNLDSDHADTVRPNSTHRYQVCFEGSDIGELCSPEIVAGPTPIAPTAPADVRVERVFVPGGRTPEGIVLRPRHFISVTWRNTEIPGVRLALERSDERTIPNPDPGSSVPFIRESFWNELHWLDASVDPTSAQLSDAGISVDPSLRAGSAYRVCAVVPALGEAGRVCSQPVHLPR